MGCPHNRCAFCSMYRESRFRIRSVDEIKEDLDMAKDIYGDVRSVFLPIGLISCDNLDVQILRFFW